MCQLPFFDDSVSGKTWENIFSYDNLKPQFINTENIHFIDVWIQYNRFHLMKLPKLVCQNWKISSEIRFVIIISH